MGEVSLAEVVKRLVAHGAVAEPDIEKEREEQERRAADALHERLVRARVPEPYREVVEAGLEKTPAVLAVDAWLLGCPPRRDFLFLVGGYGTGKSVAAAYALSRIGGRWCKAPDVALYRFSLEHLEPLRNAPNLVIDDLGKEENTPAAHAALLTLIDHRFEQGGLTLVTTNLSADRLRAVYDDGGRLLDRMRQVATWVELAGPSMRSAR